MGKKPKAGGTPRKRPKIEDPAQSRRFIETARELVVDESDAAFERAFMATVKSGKTKTRSDGTG